MRSKANSFITGEWSSLSLGERAGVRASFIFDCIFTAKFKEYAARRNSGKDLANG